jgi:hypothetical protein
MFMKKFLFLLVATVLSLAMSAQSMTKNQPLPKQGKINHTAISAPQADRIIPHKAASFNAGGTVVTPPATLETEKYRLHSYIFDGSSWQTVNRTIQIGFDGNQVYLQGMSVYLPEAWIVGTLSDDGTMVTFPVQYYGSIYGEDLYFYPTTPVGNSYQAIDAVFYYDGVSGFFSLQQDQVTYILENAYADEIGWYYQYDSEMTMALDAGTIDVPADLETQDYMLTGVYMGIYEDGSWFEGDPLMGSAKVGFDGDDIYIQGLCSYLPGAWIKGHREGDSYVFENGQFFGIFVYEEEAYPLYFMGCEPQTNDAALMVMTPDPETGALTAQHWYGICADDQDVYWYDLLANVVLTPIADEPATPADPSILYYEYYVEDGMGYVMLDIPVVSEDGKPLLSSQLGYQLYCDYGFGAEPYIFWADYYGFDQDQTTIPYDFNDEMNILKGGLLVVIYEIGEDIQRIGVRSVYTGGGETNESNITWLDLQSPTGVTEVTVNKSKTMEYYDLMGRRVDSNNLTPGIYVRQDGRKILVK